jgi:hypothetical protein
MGAKELNHFVCISNMDTGVDVVHMIYLRSKMDTDSGESRPGWLERTDPYCKPSSNHLHECFVLAQINDSPIYSLSATRARVVSSTFTVSSILSEKMSSQQSR